MNIADYFASIERSLSQDPAISHVEVSEAITSDDFNGLLRPRVYFWDDSLLNVHETVSTELGYPVRVVYAYTYLRGDSHIFRYDNAPHHPEIITFPHHKHIGISEQIAPTDQPALGQVLIEIEQWLGK